MLPGLVLAIVIACQDLGSNSLAEKAVSVSSAGLTLCKDGQGTHTTERCGFLNILPPPYRDKFNSIRCPAHSFTFVYLLPPHS